MNDLGDAVDYDLAAAAARLVLEPPRSLDLGGEDRVLFGAFSDASCGEVFALFMFFSHTGSNGAELVRLDDVPLEEASLRPALEAVAVRRLRLLPPNGRVLINPSTRAVLLFSAGILGSLENPEEVKLEARAVGAVQNVAVRVMIVDLRNQTDVRRVGGEIAGSGASLVVPWLTPYEHLPVGLLPGTVIPIARDKADFMGHFRELLERFVTDDDDSGARSDQLGLDPTEIDRFRAALEASPMRLSIVSGHETQARISRELEATFQAVLGPGLRLEWMTGWQGASAAKGILAGTEGVIWSELVSHPLGEALRREADLANVPHTKVAGWGHGRGATARAVSAALRAAMRSRET